MLDMKFFSIPRFGAGTLGVTFSFFAMFSMFFLLSQYLQSVRDYSPLRAGFATLPFAFTMIAISPRGPALGARFGTKRMVLTGLVVMPIGLLLLSTMSQTSPYLVLAIAMVVTAAGPALCIPTMSTGIVLSLPLDKAGVGSAVNDTTREVGGAIGIAVLGSILNARYRSGLAPSLAALPAAAQPAVAAAHHGVSALAAFVHAAPGVPALAPVLPQLDTLLHTARANFVSGMQIGLRVSAAVVLVVAAIASRWFPQGAPVATGPGPKPH
jgi:predicted MFS family arabinose efflux permease